MKNLKQIINEIVDIKLNEIGYTKRLNENDEYTVIFNQIDWDRVGQEILKKFKIRTKLSFKQKGSYVVMISDDIIKQCGIFQYALGKCHLTFFSNSLNSKPDNGIIFWSGINLTYPGNGMSIGDLWVKEDGTIIVQKVTPRSST